MPGSTTVSGFQSVAHPVASPDVPAGEGIRVSAATDGAEWDGYLARHPDATVDHLWGWRAVLGGVFRHRCEYFIARRGAAVCGVLPVVLVGSRLFGRSAISVPFLNYGGVLADDPEASGALVAAAESAAREFGASHLELRHVARQFEALPFRQHKVGMARRLPASSDILWSEIDRKIRNQVRKAQKASLEVVFGGAERLDEFYQVFATNMRDLGTPVYSRRLFSETLRVFPDQARVALVRHDGRPIAGAVTIAWRGTVLNPWASSLREFRPLCPNVLLYWAMLEQAIAEGASRFDFGRSSPGGGTYQFKAQWGAQPVPLHWEYVLLSRSEPPDQGPTNPRFHLAIRCWQHLPVGLASLLGPVIARHLP